MPARVRCEREILMTGKDILPGLAALLLFMAGLTGCAQTTRQAPSVEADFISLAPYVARLRKVEVFIDGKPHDFLFDTGGGYTLVSPEVQAASGCEPSGKLTGFRMSGERLDFQKCGGVEFRVGETTFNVEAGLFDINSLLPDTLPPLYGVLSMHTFADGILTLDLANNRMMIETPASLRVRTQTMQRLDARFYNELEGRGMDVYLEVAAKDGKHVLMLLDSGNLGLNVLTAPAWQEISDSAVPAEGKTNELALDFGTAGSRTLPVGVRAIIREGALNVDFVESGIFTFDFPNRRAWVTWNETTAEH